MSVTAYQKNGQELWKVYVNLRSTKDRMIRVQKHVVDLQSRAAAETKEKKLLTELAKEVQRREGIGTTWAVAIDRWEIYMRSLDTEDQDWVEPGTLQDMLNLLRRWTQAWLERTASEINVADVKTALNEAKKEGRSTSFQGKLKSAINSVFHWGIQEGWIKGARTSPAEGIKLKRSTDEKVPEILNMDQIRTLLLKARQVRHDWYPIWAVGLLTGMRNGELHALRWSRVDFENRLIRVEKSYNTKEREDKCTKGGYWRTVPISDELMGLLKELKLQSRDREHVLPRFHDWDRGGQARILRSFCEAAELPSIKFHTLRACFATQLTANGVAQTTVMKVCGWKTLKVMQRYIRLAGVEEKGATDSLSVLPPEADAMGHVVQMPVRQS